MQIDLSAVYYCISTNAERKIIVGREVFSAFRKDLYGKKSGKSGSDFFFGPKGYGFAPNDVYGCEKFISFVISHAEEDLKR